MKDSRLSAIVLAGGRGRRMGGQDKGLIPFNNRPMVTWLTDTLNQLTDDITISANRHVDDYARLGYPVVADTTRYGEYAGPLSGIVSCVSQVRGSIVVVAPCDMPGITEEAVTTLVEALGENGVACYSDGERQQSLFFVAKTNLLATIDDYLGEGGRSVRGWLESQGAMVRSARNPEWFRNINLPSDLG